MTTVRIPEGRSFPLRLTMLVLAWLVPLAVLGIALGWFLWECRQEVEALEQEIVELNTEHATAVAALVVRIEELQAEKAALEETIAEQDAAMAYLDGERERLIAQNDVLLAKLSACLEELNQPKPVQEVLPTMIRDDAATVVVVDDSGSMSFSIADVREALRGIQGREDELPNAQLSVLVFGTAVQRLFDFTGVGFAPWDYAVDQVDAGMGGTNIHLALETAYNDIKAHPKPEKRILLLSDGQGTIAPELIRVIAQDNIKVDTMPFGGLADLVLLERIADETGGTMRRAN